MRERLPMEHPQRARVFHEWVESTFAEQRFSEIRWQVDRLTRSRGVRLADEDLRRHAPESDGFGHVLPNTELHWCVGFGEYEAVRARGVKPLLDPTESRMKRLVSRKDRHRRLLKPHLQPLSSQRGGALGKLPQSTHQPPFPRLLQR